MTPEEQKRELANTILRKLRRPASASVKVQRVSRSRSKDIFPRPASLDRGTTKSQ